MEINRERAIKFLQKLIRKNTVNPPGKEYDMAKEISEYAGEHHLKSEIKAFAKDRANIIIELEGKNSELPPLVYSGHLDTVSIGDRKNWRVNPLSGKLMDGKIYGRGSCDMKSGIAGFIEAMISMKESGDLPETNIIFIGTAGEEVDCIGAQKILDEKIISHAGAMIIAEPSNNRVYSAHKGALWIEIEIYGKTAHSSMPNEGINAIVHMLSFLEKLKQFNFSNHLSHTLLGNPTLNISTIQGGVQTNVVPDQCKVTIDIRTIPETKHEEIVEEIQTILTELERELDHFHSKLNVLHDLPAISNNENDVFVELAIDVNQEIQGIEEKEEGANYYTDGSVFGPDLGIPIIIYGPGDVKLAHQPNEYVDVEKYIEAIYFYILIAKAYSNPYLLKEVL